MLPPSNERIHAGLPVNGAEIAVDDRVIGAFDKGIIKESDLVPNMTAVIHHTIKPEVDPPLSTLEAVERHRIVQQLAAQSIAAHMDQRMLADS